MSEQVAVANDLFHLHDRVQIINTGSPLDGTEGTIQGLSVDHVVRIWIVKLDAVYRSHERSYAAITLPESCLVRLS